MGDKTKGRIVWIDALKAIACLGVLLHHFLLCFYPAAYLGETGMMHMGGDIEIRFSQSFLSFFTNGDFFVDIFCILIGYVTAKKVISMKDTKQFADALVKRYFRLALPVFAVGIVVFIMLRMNVFCNAQAGYYTGSEWLTDFYLDKTTLGDLFYISFIQTMFQGFATQYSQAFWMYNDLLLGSYLSYIAAAAYRKNGVKINVVYWFFVILFLFMDSRMAVFMLGVIAAVNEKEETKDKKKDIIIAAALLFVGIFLSGYPSGVTPTNYYAVLNHLPDRINPYHFWHIFSAFFVINGLSIIHKYVKMEKCRGFSEVLGKMSFGIYLWHIPVMYSAGAFAFIKMTEAGKNYGISSFTALLVTLLITLPVAFIYGRYIDPAFGVLINKCLSEKKKESNDEE